MPAFGDEDIGRFDVAMNDALGVSRIERIGDFDAEGEDGVQFDGATSDAMLQR